jgi:hypothetical protein
VEDAWLRACATCGDPFVVDRACGFNRRYCSEACAAVGRAKSVGRAQKAYRDKPAVRERHCQQERARRARLAGRVRDHIQQPAFGRVTVGGMVVPKRLVATASPVVELAPPALELAPAAGLTPLPPPAGPPASATVPPDATASPPVASKPGAGPTGWPRLAQWRLIVGHALAAHAEGLRRRGAVVHCACCGRAGRVAAIVVRAELEWRRQPDEDGA